MFIVHDFRHSSLQQDWLIVSLLSSPYSPSSSFCMHAIHSILLLCTHRSDSSLSDKMILRLSVFEEDAVVPPLDIFKEQSLQSTLP